MQNKIFALILSYCFCAATIGIAQPIQLPYKKMGWTEEEAASHLLNRLGYGPRPGDIAAVTEMGLEIWVERQLEGTVSDDSIHQALQEKYPALTLSVEENSQVYPSPPIRAIFMLFTAQHNGRDLDALRERAKNKKDDRQSMEINLMDNILNVRTSDNPKYRMAQKFIERRYGFKPFNDYVYQLMAQKLERAVYHPHQLQEVLTDFWLNHFNVSLTRLTTASHILSYERDAIRPHVLGNFADMLKATAMHPAMLYYLDNHRSNAAEGVSTLQQHENTDIAAIYGAGLSEELKSKLNQVAQKPGLNENYARELLELHTLGVDGGYTQRDVEELARIFTGWKASPFLFPQGDFVDDQLIQHYKSREGVVLQDGFLFEPGWHDAEAKTVLGTPFPAGRGMEEGIKALEMLAVHPATAQHISQKLAKKFVSDQPPAELVDQMANAFLRTQGDITSVLRTMITSEAFWDKDTYGEKVKTPLELIVSTLRVTDAQVTDYHELIRRCNAMGQPLYAFQAPTGYPEASEFWTNGSAMVERMNFSYDLVAGKIEGVEVKYMNNCTQKLQASEQEMLGCYLNHWLPVRNHEETLKLIQPILTEQEMTEKDKTVALPGWILGSPEFQKQ